MPSVFLPRTCCYLLLALLPLGAWACGGEDYCQVNDGRYLAIVPDGWDGQMALPTTVFFHGHNGSARGTSRNKGLLRAMNQEGVLLVLPDGRNNTWSNQGSPSSDRDEIAFMDAVLADVQGRWPVDKSRLYAAGFSHGGSMAWDLACQRGGEYAAFMPVAGAFWEPMPEDCPAGPVNLRHVHGTADTVVPLAGRAILEIFRQADVYAGMALWREVNGCPDKPNRQQQQNMLSCQIWDRCQSGKELQLCLHDGGHSIPRGWVRRSQRWAGELLENGGR